MAVTAQRDLVALALAPSPTEREKAARTHKIIRDHLETDPALKKYRVDTYLQGSYKNSTNVRGDSDVDMGIFTDQVFIYETAWLPTEPRMVYGRMSKSLKESVDEELDALPRGDFTFNEYRADVLASLRREYGDSVIDGNKAINVLANTYRIDADVLPCIAFRQYHLQGSAATYHKGIAFFDKLGTRHVNFPHQHFDNLSNKDQTSSGKVKGCIRILKRLRNEFEEAGSWDRKRSPSYYLEGLVWNVPDHLFVGGYQTVMFEVLKYLWSDLTEKKDKDGLGTYAQANGIFRLFSSRCWNVDDALAFIELTWRAIFSE